MLSRSLPRDGTWEVTGCHSSMLVDLEQIEVGRGGDRERLAKRGKGPAGQGRNRAENLRDLPDGLGGFFPVLKVSGSTGSGPFRDPDAR